MKIYIVLFLVAMFALISCRETPDNSVTAASTIDSSSFIQKEAEDLTTRIKEARIEKNRRDSVFAANREEVWVYQIGENKSDPKEFEKTYNLLSQRIQNLYFFKQSLRNYYLILHDGYNSEQELLGKQAEIELALQKAGVKDKISVINITTHCSLKEKIKPADEVNIARKEMAVCYTCD